MIVAPHWVGPTEETPSLNASLALHSPPGAAGSLRPLFLVGLIRKATPPGQGLMRSGHQTQILPGMDGHSERLQALLILSLSHRGVGGSCLLGFPSLEVRSEVGAGVGWALWVY